MAYPSPDLDRRLAKASGTLGLAIEAGMQTPDIEALFALAERVIDLDTDGLSGFSDMSRADQALLVETDAWWAANGDEAWARSLAQGTVTGPKPR